MRCRARLVAVVLPLALLAGCTSIGADEHDGLVAVRSSVATTRLALIQYLHGRSTEPATDTVFSDALTHIAEERQTLAELRAGTTEQRRTLRARLAAVDLAARTVQDVRSRLGSGDAGESDSRRLRDEAKRLAGS